MNLFELFVKIGADTSQAEKGMKNTQKNSETLTNKIKVMSAQFEAAQKNVDKLTQEFNESVKKTGATSKETQELAKKLDDAEKEAEQAKKALDGYNSELGETEVKAEKASGGLSNFASKLGKGLATAAKIGTAAVGAAAAGITALTTAAVNNYAEYEQLVGGVETLFKNSSDTVMKYAENAYATAGLSANQYMTTVTSFSASLLQSLGGDTEAAAKKADVAITDMADNANKMGSSLETLQTAYAGFAKGQFMLLDNLKLGYGGTQEEMKRLLSDAEKISGIKYDISSYADIVDAIHVIQTEMGIAGATALEAGTTIQGSVGAMKSAWTNLITGLADGNADIGKLVDNLVTTIVGDGTERNLGVLGNIMPAVKTALSGASKLVSELLPKIVQEIPSIINDNLPVLAEAAISIIQSLVDGISENQEMLMETALETITYLATSLISMLPQIVALGLDLIVSLANGIATSLPTLLPTIVDVILKIVDTLTSPEQLTTILNAALTLITELAYGLMDAIPQLVDACFTIIENLVDFLIDPTNIGMLLKAALDIIIAIGTGLVNSIPSLIEYWKKVPKSIIDNFKNTNWKKLGSDLLTGLWNGISDKVAWLKSKVSGVVDKIKGWFTGKDGFDEHSPSKWSEKVFRYVMDGGANGLEAGLPGMLKDVDNVVGRVKDEMSIGTFDGGFSYSGAGAAGMTYGGSTFGDIHIHVKGGNYDENKLAEALAVTLQGMTDRRAAVFGNA